MAQIQTGGGGTTTHTGTHVIPATGSQLVDLVRMHRELRHTVDGLGADFIRGGISATGDEHVVGSSEFEFILDGQRFRLQLAMVRARH